MALGSPAASATRRSSLQASSASSSPPFLVDLLKSREPNSIEVCTLFDKPERREVDVHAKYIGCAIPDAFIVGYGLDYDEKYRNLPFVGVLKPEVYGA